jgi:hypothetical protein
MLRFSFGSVWCFLSLFAFAPSSYALPQEPDSDVPHELVARWDFGSEDTSQWKLIGGIERDQPGPRPPQFPDFEENNTAIKLPGDGAHLVIADPGASSPYDFGTGDAITLEAWIKVADLAAHENHVIIGKGRTGNAGFPSDNQNWALRIRQIGGKGHVNFLFATDPQSSPSGHWHRWTSKESFEAGTGWHHVAVAYQFGDSSTIRAWLDGVRVTGQWDMGGATSLAPIVDDDEIWIGASQKGTAANSFSGSIDAVAIHRGLLSDIVMKTRFRREGPATLTLKEEMPDSGSLQAGNVTLTLHEGLASHSRWLVEDEVMPPASLRYESLPAFLLSRLPMAYDDWGIRDHWKVPLVARLSADVSIPEGKHKVMVRARGLSRLWANGELLARCNPLTGSPSGEEPITPLPQLARDNIRWPGYRQQEVVSDWNVASAGVHRIVLETMVGGKGHRPDTGELVVAIELEGTNQFRLLSPHLLSDDFYLLQDDSVEPLLSQINQTLDDFDDLRRRELAAGRSNYWVERHCYAHKIAAEKLTEIKAQMPDSTGSQLSVDWFIEEKRKRLDSMSAKIDNDALERFQSTVGALLQENCVRCHGDRALGGLQLKDAESLSLGGDSGQPAVVPEKLEESEIWRRISSRDPAERMPPNGEGLTEEQRQLLKEWILSGAQWPEEGVPAEQLVYSPMLSDAEFLRKLSLDTIGLLPTEEELRIFIGDTRGNKREAAIDQKLADPRWADHWMPYWQDVLAENPTLINASLNSTGPFRWFLYEALRDGKGVDRWVSELILLRGNPHTGGSAGFAIAGENDAPYATKAQILSSAFLGVELQCARCHDSPYHSTTQRDLFSLAAMLERKGGVVPKSSRVPAAFFERQQRVALIKATLKPDESVGPTWPFNEISEPLSDVELGRWIGNRDSREELALLFTKPENERFAEVLVNRVWRRLIGVGLVEPPSDWEGHQPSHPQLLKWLAWEFVANGYDIKHIERLILNSNLYQRTSRPRIVGEDAANRLFTAPTERRMSAEQVVDAMYQTAGKEMDVEELTFDPDGRRAADNRISLGFAQRAWMFPSLSNERDRPSLNLPKARAVLTVMEAFGWNGSRQSPRTDREVDPNVLQPGVLANSIASSWLTRASQGSGLAELAVHAKSPKELVDSLYLRYLSRLPTSEEAEPLVATLRDGFNERIVPLEKRSAVKSLEPLMVVSWSNHLVPEATTIMMELERRAQLGPPADPSLQSSWREAYEDVAWTLLNSSEFVWLP